MNVVAPFDMIRQWWVTTFRRFSTFPFILALVGIELYFYINGSAHFVDWDAGYGQIIPVYILMTVFFLVWSSAGTRRELRRPIKEAAPWFVVFFIGTYLVMLAATTIGLFQPGTLPASQFWSVIIVQVVVVGCSEELMFRGVILESTKSVIISSLLFGIWHGYSYGFVYYAGVYNWGAMIFAMIFGVILALIVKKKEWGLASAIAVHSCYNAFIVGAFATGVF